MTLIRIAVIGILSTFALTGCGDQYNQPWDMAHFKSGTTPGDPNDKPDTSPERIEGPVDLLGSGYHERSGRPSQRRNGVPCPPMADYVRRLCNVDMGMHSREIGHGTRTGTSKPNAYGHSDHDAYGRPQRNAYGNPRPMRRGY